MLKLAHNKVSNAYQKGIIDSFQENHKLIFPTRDTRKLIHHSSSTPERKRNLVSNPALRDMKKQSLFKRSSAPVEIISMKEIAAEPQLHREKHLISEIETKKEDVKSQLKEAGSVVIAEAVLEATQALEQKIQDANSRYASNGAVEDTEHNDQLKPEATKPRPEPAKKGSFFRHHSTTDKLSKASSDSSKKTQIMPQHLSLYHDDQSTESLQSDLSEIGEDEESETEVEQDPKDSNAKKSKPSGRKRKMARKMAFKAAQSASKALEPEPKGVKAKMVGKGADRACKVAVTAVSGPILAGVGAAITAATPMMVAIAPTLAATPVGPVVLAGTGIFLATKAPGYLKKGLKKGADAWVGHEEKRKLEEVEVVIMEVDDMRL